MTRASTWANPDGLNVGFGPNYPERMVSGHQKTYGVEKEARLDVTWESTFGATGAKIVLPTHVAVKDVFFEVTTAWATSDAGTLSVGDDSADTDDVDGWISATAMAAAALTPAGKHITADGVYAVGDDGGAADTDNKAPEQYRSVGFGLTQGVTIYLTKANNFTAGAGRLIVRYV